MIPHPPGRRSKSRAGHGFTNLKNPLNIIGLAAELAGAEKASPEFRKEAAARIRRQVVRINELIGEVLEFTQGSGGDTVLAPVDFAGFVKPVVEELREELELGGIAIHFENEPPEVKMPIHPARLRRVFHNLIHNAAHAMPDGGIVMLRFTLKMERVIIELTFLN